MTSLLAMPGNEVLAQRLAPGFELMPSEMRRFPDGESYVRLLGDLQGRSLAVLCTLARPDDKFLGLAFAAATARELGAARVGLIAPYLAYMRQDRRFKPGEAVTSRPFARLLSESFDWMITVDPHLHRYGSLSEIYTIPTRVVHAAPLISAWIRTNVPDPLVIGPDSESQQWVSAVAAASGAPYTVLEKVRHGDRDVEIKVKDLSTWRGRSAVLVDDIISSGRTMIAAVRQLTAAGYAAPVCIGVHGLFADDSDRLLAQAGARVVTSDTVPHPTNAISVAALLGDAVRELTAAP
jgi:ribose-phosphate pyrophosphokinase